jgi:hypothetical protein
MSNQEAMQQLADRFMNDAGFREEIRTWKARRSERVSCWTRRTDRH